MFPASLATAVSPGELFDPNGIEAALVSTGRFLLSLSAMLFLAYLFMLFGCAVLAVATGRRRAKHRSSRPAYLRRLRQQSGRRVDAGASQAA